MLKLNFPMYPIFSKTKTSAHAFNLKSLYSKILHQLNSLKQIQHHEKIVLLNMSQENKQTNN